MGEVSEVKSERYIKLDSVIGMKYVLLIKQFGQSLMRGDGR